MTVTRVIEHGGQPARTDSRHHIGQHGAQPCPGYDAAGANPRETLLDPSGERPDPVIPDITVIAAEFRRTRNPEPIISQPAGDYLGGIVQQTDRRCRFLGGLVVQLNGDGIPLHRVNVDSVPQLGGQFPATHARTDHHTIKGVTSLLFTIKRGDPGVGLIRTQFRHRVLITGFDAEAKNGLRQAIGELMDITG